MLLSELHRYMLIDQDNGLKNTSATYIPEIIGLTKKLIDGEVDNL